MPSVKRFSNPHTSSSFHPISRADLHAIEHPSASTSISASQPRTEPEIASLEARLDELISNSIDVPCFFDTKTNEEKMKPSVVGNGIADERVLFRLISRKLPPRLVSFSAPHPHLEANVVRPREVAVEDMPEEAEERRARAMAVAVDFDSVMASSSLPVKNMLKTKPHHPYHRPQHTQHDKKVWHATLVKSRAKSSHVSLSSPLLALESVKKPRKTRPLVDAGQLAYHPYKLGAMNPAERAQAGVVVDEVVKWAL